MPPPLDVHVVRTLWLQMLEAMQVLHRRRVVHSDLKPANFVFVKGTILRRQEVLLCAFKE